MRVNISIDDTLITDFDTYCDKYRYTRSELLSKLMRDVVYSVCKPIVSTPQSVPARASTVPVITEPITYGPSDDMSNLYTGEENIGYCEEHFEKGKVYPRLNVQIEDPNGRVLGKKNMCNKCLDSYKNRIKESGGTITAL